MASILAAAGIPTAVLGLLVWQLKRRIERQEARQEAAEKAREEFETNLYESSLAAIALGEATAKAVQRIPDAHCNGDMHAALDYAAEVKHKQRDHQLRERNLTMEAVLTNILNVVPGWLALVLMLGGFAFYVLGAIRLGYGATVRPLVLDLIERAEHEIQGTKRGAERKAWVAAKLRAALDASKFGRLFSWAITDETIGRVIQFCFDRAKDVVGKQ